MSDLQKLPSPARAYRGRFAPSPTGPLHAGSLVAALGSWLDARAHQGQWLLRIEDVDTPRSVFGAAQQIEAQLLACGLQWDEEPMWQSKQQESYQKAFNQLIEEGQLYPCNCSRQTIAKTLEALGIETERHQDLVYPGSCRGKLGRKNEEPSTAWRIALPKHCAIEFEDRALGHQIQNLNQEATLSYAEVMVYLRINWRWLSMMLNKELRMWSGAKIYSAIRQGKFIYRKYFTTRRQSIYIYP